MYPGFALSHDNHPLNMLGAIFWCDFSGRKRKKKAEKFFIYLFKQNPNATKMVYVADIRTFVTLL